MSHLLIGIVCGVALYLLIGLIDGVMSMKIYRHKKGLSMSEYKFNILYIFTTVSLLLIGFYSIVMGVLTIVKVI